MERFDIWCIVVAAFVFIAFISMVKILSDIRRDYKILARDFYDLNLELIRRADHKQTTCIDAIIETNESLLGLASELSGEITVDIDDDDKDDGDDEVD